MRNKSEDRKVKSTKKNQIWLLSLVSPFCGEGSLCFPMIPGAEVQLLSGPPELGRLKGRKHTRPRPAVLRAE